MILCVCLVLVTSSLRPDVLLLCHVATRHVQSRVEVGVSISLEVLETAHLEGK
jgi:hypothetical protein